MSKRKTELTKKIGEALSKGFRQVIEGGDGMRRAKAGDKVRVVEPIDSYCYYEEDDILTIRKIDIDGDYYVEEHDLVMFEDEFEVIDEGDDEDMTKEKDCNTIKMTLPDGTIIEGTAESLAEMPKLVGSTEASEESDKAVKVGDTIKAVAGDYRSGNAEGEPAVGWYKAGQGLVKIGAYGKVKEVNSDDIVAEFDEDEDGSKAGLSRLNRFTLHRSEYDVVSEGYEKITFKVGDKAKVKSRNVCMHGFYVGDTVEIIGIDSDNPRYIIDNEGSRGYANAENLTKIDSADIEAGDYAKVVGETRYGDIDEGTVVKVVEERVGLYVVDFGQKIELIDGTDFDRAKAGSLEKYEPTDRELSFLRAGRNFGETKKGDIVEVTDYIAGHNVGVIGLVTGVDEEGVALVTAYDGDYGRKKEWYEDDLKLVAPASARVDVEDAIRNV